MNNQFFISSLALAASMVVAGSTPALGEIVGISAVSIIVPVPVPTGWGWVVPFDLYVRSNSPTDNIIGVSNATIFLSGPVPTWHNESPGPGQPIAGAMPLTGIDVGLQPQMEWESFVTIGHDQTAAFNDTVLEPSFEESLFLTDGSIGESTGWYNSNPSNGQGLVGSFDGPFGLVLLGRFTIVFPDEPFAGGIPDLNITSLTITYTTGLFGSELQTWTLPSPLIQSYYVPAPGAALLLLGAGMSGRRRKR